MERLPCGLSIELTGSRSFEYVLESSARRDRDHGMQPWAPAPGYMIRDRDSVYGTAFGLRVKTMGIKEVASASRSRTTSRAGSSTASISMNKKLAAIAK